MAFEYETLNINFPMYGYSQTPSGQVIFNNTQSMLDDAMIKVNRDAITDEFVSESLDVNRELKKINSIPVVQKTQNVGGGRLFRVKPSKYRR